MSPRRTSAVPTRRTSVRPRRRGLRARAARKLGLQRGDHAQRPAGLDSVPPTSRPRPRQARSAAAAGTARPESRRGRVPSRTRARRRRPTEDRHRLLDRTLHVQRVREVAVVSRAAISGIAASRRSASPRLNETRLVSRSGASAERTRAASAGGYSLDVDRWTAKIEVSRATRYAPPRGRRARTRLRSIGPRAASERAPTTGGVARDRAAHLRGRSPAGVACRPRGGVRRGRPPTRRRFRGAPDEPIHAGLRGTPLGSPRASISRRARRRRATAAARRGKLEIADQLDLALEHDAELVERPPPRLGHQGERVGRRCRRRCSR